MNKMGNIIRNINQSINHHKVVLKSLRTNRKRNAANEIAIEVHQGKLDVYKEIKMLLLADKEAWDEKS